MDLKKVVSSKVFDKFILFIIIINSVTLGIETYKGVSPQLSYILKFLDHIFLGVFVFETILKMAAFRLGFFRDPWRIFDFLVISVSLVPASSSFSIIRSLRVLRTLRMVSVVPSLKRVVNSLLLAIPGLGAVGAILLLTFYVGSVMATELFGEYFPEWFGSLGASAYTLFQVMTLESWSMGIVRPVMEQFPLSWLFFLPFILITTFTMLNLFIAVIVSAMQIEADSASKEETEQGQKDRDRVLSEILVLREKVDKFSMLMEQSMLIKDEGYTSGARGIEHSTTLNYTEQVSRND